MEENTRVRKTYKDLFVKYKNTQSYTKYCSKRRRELRRLRGLWSQLAYKKYCNIVILRQKYWSHSLYFHFWFSDLLRVQEVRSVGAGPDPTEDYRVGKNLLRKIQTNLQGMIKSRSYQILFSDFRCYARVFGAYEDNCVIYEIAKRKTGKNLR